MRKLFIIPAVLLVVTAFQPMKSKTFEIYTKKPNVISKHDTINIVNDVKDLDSALTDLNRQL